MGRVFGEVVRLVGIHDQVVELLGGNLPLAPTIREKQILARAVVGIRQDWLGTLPEAPDVLPAVGADAPLGLVGDVVGLLGEDGVPDLLGLPAREREERLALQPLRSLDTDQITDRGEEVYVGDEGVAGLSTRETARSAQDEHDTETSVVEGGLRTREGETMVRGADDERVLGQAFCVEGVEHGPYTPVQRAGALLEGGHVEPRLWRVRQVGWWCHVVGLLRGAGTEPFPVGLEEPDREKERPVARAF